MWHGVCRLVTPVLYAEMVIDSCESFWVLQTGHLFEGLSLWNHTCTRPCFIAGGLPWVGYMCVHVCVSVRQDLREADWPDSWMDLCLWPHSNDCEVMLIRYWSQLELFMVLHRYLWTASPYMVAIWLYVPQFPLPPNPSPYRFLIAECNTHSLNTCKWLGLSKYLIKSITSSSY